MPEPAVITFTTTLRSRSDYAYETPVRLVYDYTDSVTDQGERIFQYVGRS